MSDKERHKNVGSSGDGKSNGGEGGYGDDEDGPESKKCEGCEKRGKGVSLFRRRKGKKLQDHRRKQKGNSVNPGCWARRGGGGSGCFCLCVKQPRTLDSSGESPTSDPNSPEFTFDMLRAFIENNNFYSKECNPHLDAGG